MISQETARSGHPVLKKDGRFLGSSYDPLKEAKVWAERIASEIAPEENAIVLGLGSGYHVVELAKLLSSNRVLAIENDPEVAAGALALCKDLQGSMVVVEPMWLGLPDHDRFRDFNCSAFQIGKHAPSCLIERDYFQNVENLLLGRDRTSFLLQLKMRPEMRALFDLERLEQMPDETVSIKTLQKLFSHQAVHRHERMLWRLLEELVL